jgi:hypothetical protein
VLPKLSAVAAARAHTPGSLVSSDFIKVSCEF